MKKRFTVILSFVFAICLCFAFTACGGLFGFGTNSNGGSGNTGSSGGNSGNNSGSSSSGGSNQPKEDNDGTFVYSGASIKAANTSISGEITIPAEHGGVPIDTIPANAFKGCNAITSIVVPESVTTIGAGAFSGCSSLRSITLPFVGGQKGNSDTSAACFGYIFGTSSYQGGTKIRQAYGTGIGRYEDFYIPSTLRNVTITKESVLNYGAFQNCSMLAKIELNDSIIQVGANCFINCSKIETISLPSISIIPDSLFSGCISLNKFTINPSVDTIGEAAFKGCSTLSMINSELAGDFIIPNAVTSIGYAAFSGCSMIKSITLPFVGCQKGNSGTSKACFGYIFGEDSYQGGTKIRQIYDTGIGQFEDFYIPSILRSVTITSETVLCYGAFQNCSMLTTIKINKGAQNNVGEKAFENTATPTWV